MAVWQPSDIRYTDFGVRQRSYCHDGPLPRTVVTPLYAVGRAKNVLHLPLVVTERGVICRFLRSGCTE